MPRRKTPPRARSAAKTQSFEADVSRLLHLMVHSVYSDRDIFVRELVSNAADACEKLRYEALAKPELIEGGGPFAITIAVDPEKKTLTFSDNGVGMSREDLVEALGTIARSGTRAFLDRLAAESADKEAKEATSLIGQFGIGFYSSFMVADEVTVETRRAGGAEAWRWTSDGKGAYTIAPLALDDAPQRGTRVMLHLNAESHDYAEPARIERIVKRAFRRGRRADRHHRQAGRRAAPPHRRRRDLGEVEVRRHARRIQRILSRPLRPVRRAGADRALARRGAARIYRARLHPGLAAVRSVRSRAQAAATSSMCGAS